MEEWERTLCENKAVAILAEVQAGRPTLIHKDGGEMLIAIVLDRPLAEAKELVDDPAAFTREMTRILRDKQTHPLIAQMMRPSQKKFLHTGTLTRRCQCPSFCTEELLRTHTPYKKKLLDTETFTALAESSDPPPATAADSGASSSREPRHLTRAVPVNHLR